jgi:hypothetical protein
MLFRRECKWCKDQTERYHHRKIIVTSTRLGFEYAGGATNCFWKDLWRCPRRRFLRSFVSGFRRWVRGSHWDRF